MSKWTKVIFRGINGQLNLKGSSLTKRIYTQKEKLNLTKTE